MVRRHLLRNPLQTLCYLSLSAVKDHWTHRDKERPSFPGGRNKNGEESPLLNAFPAHPLQPMVFPHSQPPSDSSPPSPDSRSHKPSPLKITTQHTVKHTEMKMVDMPEVVKLPHQIQPSVTHPLCREAPGGHVFPVSVFWTRLWEFGIWSSRQETAGGVWGGVPPLLPTELRSYPARGDCQGTMEMEPVFMGFCPSPPIPLKNIRKCSQL